MSAPQFVEIEPHEGVRLWEAEFEGQKLGLDFDPSRPSHKQYGWVVWEEDGYLLAHGYEPVWEWARDRALFKVAWG